MKHIKPSDLQFEPQQGSERVFILNENDFGLNAKAQIVRVDPGQHLKPHVHKIRIELAQVMSGEGDIVVNGKAVVSKPGEFVLVEPGDVHTLINRGQDKFVVMVLTVNDPGPEDMIWVEEEAGNE